MCLLKEKIAKAAAFKARQCEKQGNTVIIQTKKEPALDINPKTYESHVSPKKRKRNKEVIFTPESTRRTKNIVKNFGRAICSFASSPLALPYLQPLLQKHDLPLTEFIAHVRKMKQNIKGLFKFRNLLLPSYEDSQEAASNKNIFIQISEIFIKYFSVNWITHGKIQYKDAHIKFRFKMLRRIKSPQLFTYLKDGKNQSPN